MSRKKKKYKFILFVDNEQICHDVAALVINTLLPQYKMVSAYNGAEAMGLAAKWCNNLAIIFLDILLPDMQGYEIYTLLKKNPRTAIIPVVFQSGWSDCEKDLKQFLRGEEINILYKPYNINEFIDKINMNSK